MKDEQFLAELEGQILNAAAREGRTRDRRRAARPLPRIAAAAAVVAVVAAGVLVARPDTAAAGVEITREGPDLVVRLTDLESDPEEIERAVADAGLDISIVDKPVGPSLVGRFLGSSGTEMPPLLEVVEGDPSSGFTGFRIPANFDGSLTLRIGRPAVAGEEWAILSDATAPGEVLACESVVGSTLAEVADVVASDGAQLRVMNLDTSRWVHGDPVEELGEAIAVRVSSPSPEVVWVDISEHPDQFDHILSEPPVHEGC